MKQPHPALVVRILSGRLRDAEHALSVGDTLTLGHAMTHDVILRGTETAGCSIALHVAPAAIVVTVVDGVVKLLDRTLVKGEEGVLPLFTPLRIGEFVAAVGEPQSTRWGEIAGLIKYLGDGPVDGASAAPLPPTAWSKLTAMSARWRPTAISANAMLIPVVLVGAVLLSVGGVHVASAVASAAAVEDRARAAAQELERRGFHGLRVSQDSVNGHLIIAGVVGSNAQLVELQHWAPTQFGRAMIDVETADAVAQAARDVLADEGINGDVSVEHSGIVTVRSSIEPSDAGAARVIALLNDIGSIRKVRWAPRNSASERASIQQYFASSTHGIATVVESDPGFIVTADGSRWFPGAVLPTGHRLVSIADGKITLMRDGRADILSL